MMIIHHHLPSDNCFHPHSSKYVFVSYIIRGSYFRQLKKTHLNIGKDKFVGHISFPGSLRFCELNRQL